MDRFTFQLFQLVHLPLNKLSFIVSMYKLSFNLKLFNFQKKNLCMIDDIIIYFKNA